MRRRKKRHGPILSDFLYDIVDDDLEGDKYFYDFVNRHRQKADNEFFERGPIQEVRGRNYLDGPVDIGIECVCTTEWDGPYCEQSTFVTNYLIFIIINHLRSFKLIYNFVSTGILILFTSQAARSTLFEQRNLWVWQSNRHLQLYLYSGIRGEILWNSWVKLINLVQSCPKRYDTTV